MRYFTLLISLCIGVSVTQSQSGWDDITPGTDLPGLYGLFTLDGSDIWVVGGEGTILHSLNGGESWIPIEGVTTQTIYAVEFINADTGWLGCDNDGGQSVLLRTTDGGATWENQTVSGGNGSDIHDIDFVERPGMGSSRGYCTGGLSYAWLTDDYGETWTSINGACGEGSFVACSIVDENTGWFAGFASTINPSTVTQMTEAGSTWTPQANPTGQPLRGISFANSEQGIAVGNVGTIINTANGGELWVSRANDGSGWQGVFMTAAGKAWAVGNDGNIAYSSNFGDAWSMQESGTTNILWDAYFIDDNEGWVVGGGIGTPGIILHTTTGGVVSNINENLSEKYGLAQNHPNPFSTSTTIAYRVDRPALIRIIVYNLLGDEVATLVQEHKGIGEYTVDFTPDNLQIGIYYSQLEADGKTVITSKMVLLR